MMIRDNMSAVIEGLQNDHSLLAAYLEATDKIDWRAALRKRVVTGETPKPVNVEAPPASTAPQLPEVVPSTSFMFRRANLVRAS